MISLGSRVTDKITGFTGVVIGYCSYITGCNQALVNPAILDKDGKMLDSMWLDEQRLAVDRTVQLITLDNDNTPGFDKPAPKI